MKPQSDSSLLTVLLRRRRFRGTFPTEADELSFEANMLTEQ